MTPARRSIQHARKARSLARQRLYGSALAELAKAWRYLDKASETAPDRMLLRLLRCLMAVQQEICGIMVEVHRKAA